MNEYHTCINEKNLVTSSSQCCLIDDPQDREGTIFIPYSLAVQAARNIKTLNFYLQLWI